MTRYMRSRSRASQHELLFTTEPMTKARFVTRLCLLCLCLLTSSRSLHGSFLSHRCSYNHSYDGPCVHPQSHGPIVVSRVRTLSAPRGSGHSRSPKNYEYP
ncbi:Hypothetical predicted protein [Xyrichtys novacula]|uniref:Secreted protein n=1 Tax=Xyrichtys novacula TaxID=13765 RepID=A0AAV1HDJ7_XYRNO|nr:Hypothetical predicted protein [Xyrichtys novacula]